MYETLEKCCANCTILTSFFLRHSILHKSCTKQVIGAKNLQKSELLTIFAPQENLSVPLDKPFDLCYTVIRTFVRFASTIERPVRFTIPACNRIQSAPLHASLPYDIDFYKERTVCLWQIGSPYSKNTALTVVF